LGTDERRWNEKKEKGKDLNGGRGREKGEEWGKRGGRRRRNTKGG